MNFRDQIRNEVFENDRIRNEELNRGLPFDLDEVCDEFLRARADEVLDKITSSGMKNGEIINENGRRIFRKTLDFEQMYYMSISQDFKRYVNQLNLPRNISYVTSDGMYELKYVKYDYSLCDDEWSICRTNKNQNNVMHAEMRKQKIGLFGSKYRYEMKIDKCYDLQRFVYWFEEGARKEGIQASFYPYVCVNVSRGRNYVNKYMRLTAFDEWFDCEPSQCSNRIGVTIQVDVEL